MCLWWNRRSAWPGSWAMWSSLPCAVVLVHLRQLHHDCDAHEYQTGDQQEAMLPGELALRVGGYVRCEYARRVEVVAQRRFRLVGKGVEQELVPHLVQIGTMLMQHIFQ